MKKILFIAALLILGLAWMGEKLSTKRLTAELIRLRQQRAAMAGLLRERDRLSQQLNEAEKLARTRQEQAEPAILPSVAKPEELQRVTLPLGDWVGVRACGFRGQITPQASIESVLWAAAGGDVATLKQILFVSEEMRTVAAELLVALPASSRMVYQSPDDLISAFTIKRIPLGEAQLVWLNQSGPDDATACLFLNDPIKPIGASEPEPAPQDAGKVPPQLPADRSTGPIFLSLQREGNRWRLVVPPIVIEVMARQLGVVAKSGS